MMIKKIFSYIIKMKLRKILKKLNVFRLLRKCRTTLKTLEDMEQELKEPQPPQRTRSLGEFLKNQSIVRNKEYKRNRGEDWSSDD